jgi:hypothetical protein
MQLSVTPTFFEVTPAAAPSAFGDNAVTPAATAPGAFQELFANLTAPDASIQNGPETATPPPAPSTAPAMLSAGLSAGISAPAQILVRTNSVVAGDSPVAVFESVDEPASSLPPCPAEGSPLSSRSAGRTEKNPVDLELSAQITVSIDSLPEEIGVGAGVTGQTGADRGKDPVVGGGQTDRIMPPNPKSVRGQHRANGFAGSSNVQAPAVAAADADTSVAASDATTSPRNSREVIPGRVEKKSAASRRENDRARDGQPGAPLPNAAGAITSVATPATTSDRASSFGLEQAEATEIVAANGRQTEGQTSTAPAQPKTRVIRRDTAGSGASAAAATKPAPQFPSGVERAPVAEASGTQQEIEPTQTVVTSGDSARRSNNPELAIPGQPLSESSAKFVEGVPSGAPAWRSKNRPERTISDIVTQGRSAVLPSATPAMDMKPSRSDEGIATGFEAPRLAPSPSAPPTIEPAIDAGIAHSTDVTPGSIDTTAARPSGELPLNPALPLPGAAGKPQGAATTDVFHGAGIASPASGAEAKFAANASAVEMPAKPAAGALIKKFLGSDKQSLVKRSETLGTDIAKADGVMPALFPRRELTAELDVRPASTVSAPVPDATARTLSTLPPEAGLAAHRAVDAVLSATERFTNGHPHSVSLQFSMAGIDLNVRVELRAGEVHATFRTDSDELRTALATEWQSVNASGNTGALKLADPVFTSSGGSSASPFSGDGAAQQRDAQSRQARESSSAPSSRMPAAPSKSAEVAPHVPRLASLATALHLQTFA